MKGFLLDTDIVIFFLRNKKGIREKLAKLNVHDIYISEITVADLEYGNHCSGRYEENKLMIDEFLSNVNIVPFSKSIAKYASERYRLQKEGMSISDFDLIIGCSAVAMGLTMLTNNISHFSRIKDIKIESWIKD